VTVTAKKLLDAMVGATIVRVCGSEDANHIHYPVHGPGIRQHRGCVGVPPVGRMKRNVRLNLSTSFNTSMI
jgi:hypothetical protein